MFKFRMNSDAIQFWIMVTGALTLGGYLLGWVADHFASAESVMTISKRVDTEVEERKELKGEIDGLYLRLIPVSQQAPISHPGHMKGKE